MTKRYTVRVVLEKDRDQKAQLAEFCVKLIKANVTFEPSQTPEVGTALSASISSDLKEGIFTFISSEPADVIIQKIRRFSNGKRFEVLSLLLS